MFVGHKIAVEVHTHAINRIDCKTTDGRIEIQQLRGSFENSCSYLEKVIVGVEKISPDSLEYR